MAQKHTLNNDTPQAIKSIGGSSANENVDNLLYGTPEKHPGSL